MGKVDFTRQWKDRLRSHPLFVEPWTALRRSQLHSAYDKRREHYAKLAEEKGLVYNVAGAVASVRSRLSDRGYSPVPRAEGDIHTFAVIPAFSWHSALLPDLEALGPVTLFDYHALGFRWEEFYKADRAGIARRGQMNEMLLAALREAHARRPVDWVFVYASGLEVSGLTIRRISEELGVPTVNMCLDDKQSWSGQWMGDHPAGQIGIAPEFDLSWTSARVACEWYMAEGGRPIYMPEGFDAATYRPMNISKDIPVGFVGEAYGFRFSAVRYLHSRGIDVHTFGRSWPGSEWVESIVEVFNRSRINLGFGGIGYSESLTNVKGRDFDVPGTGGGMYLTSFNPDLAMHFRVGEEIICYRNREEMLELIRYYLAHEEEADQIAQRARERCLAEHRWLHRYKKVLDALGVLKSQEDNNG